jgi:hypothetical protein
MMTRGKPHAHVAELNKQRAPGSLINVIVRSGVTEIWGTIFVEQGAKLCASLRKKLPESPCEAPVWSNLCPE